ncbi:bacteriocin [Neisseria dentiae]|nr:bacteriocin [Neisseria dentiae]
MKTLSKKELQQVTGGIVNGGCTPPWPWPWLPKLPTNVPLF